MDRVNRKDCPEKEEPGRVIRTAFGIDGKVKTEEAIMSFVTLSPRSGTMEAHAHCTETMYVEDAKNAFICYGKTQDQLDRREKLAKGDLLCAAAGEWHKFDFDSDDGFADLVIFMPNKTQQA